MPGIGNPNAKTENNFRNIKIRREPLSAKGNQQTKSKGDQLNQLAGIKPESQYVDAKEHNKLGKDGFLKMLAFQMKNQDPYKPMDQKRFAADLAQFSQLEQLANLNSKFEANQKNKGIEEKSLGASFLGKEVTTSGTTVDADGVGSNVNLPFHLSKPAKKVMVRIFDSSKQLINQIEIDGMGQGQQSVTWNGLQFDGQPAVKGEYRFDVKGYDEQFNEFKGDTQSKGIVTGVHFANGETVLEVDKTRTVFLRDVQSFKLPDPNHKLTAQKMPTLNKSAHQAYNNTAENTISN